MIRALSILGCVCLALDGLNAQAQAPELEWQRCLGGSYPEESWAIQPTLDGGYMVLGTTTSNDGDVSGNHGGRDFWLIKLDHFGTPQWQRCYGGTGNETARDLLAASDGGFLLIGSAGSADGDADCANAASHPWALKADSTGNIQWQVCLGIDPNGSGAAFSRAVETADGGYLLVGGTHASHGIWHENHGQGDFFALKLDDGGMVEWLHCYGGSGSEEAIPVRSTPDGGYVIAGISNSTDGQVTAAGYGSIWVIKIDADGNLQWNRRMGGSSGPNMGQTVQDLLVNPDGSVLVVCTVGANDGDISGNHGSRDVWLVLLDGSGTILRQRCFGGTGWDSAWSGVTAGQGRYVIAGSTQSNDGDVSGNHGGTGQDAWVFMVDADLDLLWQKCLGGTGGEAAFAVSRTLDDGTIISGYTNSDDGDVSGLHPPGTDDIWVTKLAPYMDMGIADPKGGTISIFPSPTSNFLEIHLPDALPANACLDVLDPSGRIVLHEPMAGRPSIMRIDVSGWALGMYFIRLDVGMGIRAARFVKQ
ncbi:MAG: T9SS type A sorting domain-containing protein [Flavobacteriales bacterium]|nr:T9SS type A sorting domain-containing protein [Flavobacteriales bacterium]